MHVWDGWHQGHEAVDGFTHVPNIKSAVTIRARYSTSRHVHESLDATLDSAVPHKLAHDLVEKMIKEKVISYYKMFDAKSFSDTIEAEITVCPSGTKMCNIVDECFKVNGELFTEEEIIKAIKNTYPDRLI